MHVFELFGGEVVVFSFTGADCKLKFLRLKCSEFIVQLGRFSEKVGYRNINWDGISVRPALLLVQCNTVFIRGGDVGKMHSELFDLIGLWRWAYVMEMMNYDSCWLKH